MMLVNGASAESVPATDRGLAYGDGAFRTLRASNGEPLHWARHYAKLHADCGRLGIVCPAEALLLHETRTVAGAYPQAVVKLIVTRGSGPRGYPPPEPAAPLRVVTSAAAPISTNRAGVAAHLCQLRLSHQPALAGVKHLNRLENVLARAEWRDPALAEGVLRDQSGWVIGGTMSNLCLIEPGGLVTPGLTQCGVQGVTLGRVQALAAGLGLNCQTADIPLQRLLDAEGAFFINSVIGLWPLVRVGARTWPVGEITLAVANALEAEDAIH